MKEGIDIYGQDNRIAGGIRRLKESSATCRNKKFIMKFYEHCVLTNLSKSRQLKYLDMLKSIALMLSVDFDKATLGDVQRVVKLIQERKWSPWTKQNFRVALKRFYKWLKGKDKEYPKLVRWINGTVKKKDCKLPGDGDLLTEDEIKQVIESCEHPRNKALICMLFESGSRIGELATLQLCNVSFDEYGVVITVQGKTGSRPIRLVVSSSYLAAWLNIHPFREDKKAPLWVNIGTIHHNKPMKYSAIKMLIRRQCSAVGIKKRVYPHLFRHSRATFMASHLTEFQMNQYFGWIQGSDMPSTYVHMNGKEVDNAVLQMHGLKTRVNSNEPKIKPVKCPRCEHTNSNLSKFCNRCGSVLDPVEAIRMQETKKKQEEVNNTAHDLMNQLIKDPEVQRILVQKMTEMGLQGKVEAL